jgi:hypothetical protein
MRPQGAVGPPIERRVTIDRADNSAPCGLARHAQLVGLRDVGRRRRHRRAAFCAARALPSGEGGLPGMGRERPL